MKQSLINHLNRTFVKGALTILPVALTFYILYWLVTTLERAVGDALRRVITDTYYFPGLGLFLGIAILYMVGLLAQALIFRKILGLGEGILKHVPLVKTIFNAFQDVSRFFDADKKNDLNKAILLRIPDSQFWMMGFVTQPDKTKLPKEIADKADDIVGVYLPMSYQLGGYTVFVSRSELEDVGMNIDQAMQFIVTAGLTTSNK